jgi:putative aldouronate transport system permease protein
VQREKSQKFALWRRQLGREKELWFWTLLFLVWWVFFFLIPLYGIVYAFFDYTPGRALTLDRFVGLKNFISFFQTRDAWMIIRNTLVISTLNMTIGFIAPIILALQLDELRQGLFKRATQTISYLPYFVSWVVVASIVTTLLNSDGVVNEVLMNLGFIDKPIAFLTTGKYFYALITCVTIWKSLGWSTILYMSAIAGIDQSLYEAGAVDGISRWGMVRYITIPCIMPTIVLLFILNIGNFLNLGYEQNLLLGQSTTQEYWEIIDTYVYRYGIQMGRYSFSIAIGLMKSVIGLILVFVSNAIAKKYTEYSIM